jgi:hypothetical protein
MPPLPSRKIHWIGGAAGDRIIESAGGAWPIQELAFSPNFGVVLTLWGGTHSDFVARGSIRRSFA